MASIFSQVTPLTRRIRTADRDIQSVEFLECARQVLPIIDKFGTGFMMVKSDISGNIERLAQRQATDASKFRLLFSIVTDEVERGEHTGAYSCTKGLLWLTRALQFLTDLLRRLYEDRAIAVSTAASDAYYATLHQYHGWITSSAFILALKLAPSREGFFAKLGTPGEQMMTEMKEFLDAFVPFLTDSHMFLKEHGLDDPTKV
ncbi:hypothetical protein WJX72_011621 [[Myrmecia] bisecta]|uniref:Glycolipid transfer protein domain-containing protein n=1 Tax=[Myrmecia] bisecta TaxID=41462 RepID=A0AAW1QTW6_9CHLO